MNTSHPHRAALRRHHPFPTLIGAAFSLLTLPLAQSASLTWDASGSSPASPAGGAGIWSSGNANWSDGTTDSAWVNANNDSAVFLGNLSGAATVTLGESITVNSIHFGSGGGGNYTVQGGGGSTLTLTSGTVTAARSSTIQASILGSSGLTKAGSATLTLFAANSYTGTTTVLAGILQARAAGALPAATTVVLGSGNNNATLDVRASQTVAGIITAGTGTGFITNTQTTGTTTLTVNPDGAGGAAADSTFAGVIRDGDATHVIGLTKAGSRTLTLTGSNSYTGHTTVSAGTLLINGSLEAGSAVSVSSAGTLGGTGNIKGSVEVLGVLAPGNSIGTLNTGNLSVGATGTLSMELGRNGLTPENDRANVAGGASLLSGANLELTLMSGLSHPANGDIFWLLSNDGGDAISGEFTRLNGVSTDLSEGSLFTWNAQQWRITYQANFDSSSFTGGNDLALMVVPEPGSLALLAAGTAFLVARRGKRAKTAHSARRFHVAGGDGRFPARRGHGFLVSGHKNQRPENEESPLGEPCGLLLGRGNLATT